MLDKYKLELHWHSIVKKDSAHVYLNGAYFCGNALSDAEKINDNDTIRLDFTKQFSRIISSYYFADLFWGRVEYRDEKVILKDARISSEFIYDLEEFVDVDYILIDTSSHDGEQHIYSLVYPATLLNKEGVEKEI